MPADNSPADGILSLNELYSYVSDFVLRNVGDQHVQVYPENSSYPLFMR